MRFSSDELIAVGRIGRPQGLRGEFRLHSYFDAPERFLDTEAYWLEPRRKMTVVSARMHAERLVLSLDDLRGRDAVEPLVGVELFVPYGELPRYEDEFFFFELRQLQVRDEAGMDRGRVVDLLVTGGKDVYEIEEPDGRRWMIPAAEPFIPVIDLEAGYMLVRPIPGMADDDAL